MYKRLIKDASLYSISSLLARGFSLITVPIYTRILSPADYGALDLLSYMAVLIPLFVGAALDQGVARFYLDTTDDMDRKHIASSVLFYNVVVFALLVPLVMPVASQLAQEWLSNQVSEGTVVLVFINIWVASIFYIANNQLKYLFRAKQSALCNIGNTLLSIGLSFVFVVYFNWGVFGVFLGMTVGQAVFAILSLYYARDCYAFVFDWKSLKMMMVYSLPLVPGTLAFYLMQYVDRYAINQINGLSDVGIYGIGARLASLVNLFLMGFQGAWSPIVMQSFRDTDSADKFRVVFNYYLFAVSVLLVGLSLFGRELLLLLTTQVFSQGFVVVPLMVLSAIVASIGQYFTYGIQIEQKSKYRLILNFVALAINVVLNYIFIPKMGIIGAALATVLSLMVVAVVGMWISQKLFYVPYNWYKIASSAALVIVISNSVTLFNPDLSLGVMMGKLIVTLMVVYVLSRLLDIHLDVKLIRRLIRSRVVSEAK